MTQTDARDRTNQILAEWDRTDSPGCIVGVIMAGELVHARGYGMANLEYGIPLAPDSVCHMASISKQFMAMAVLLLAGAGRLSLVDPIRRTLPELPGCADPIEIRHLVHHTSGLRDVWDVLMLAGWQMDDTVTRDDAMRAILRQRALNFAPGEQFLYCNTGYVLLAEIVARVSGLSFAAFTAERIFAPLGMNRTRFRDDYAMVVPHRVQGYRADNGRFRVCDPHSDAVGTTNLQTTIEDFVRWDANFDHRRVGGAMVDLLLRPGALNDGTPLSYAGGVRYRRHRKWLTVGHGGWDAGVKSEYLRFPDQRLAVLCCTNLLHLSPASLARRVADVWLETDNGDESAMDDAMSNAGRQTDVDLVGMYHHDESGDLLRVTSVGDRLAIGFDDVQPLRRVGPGAFEPVDDPLLRIARNGTERPVHRLVVDGVGGPPRVYARLDTAGAQTSDVASAAGRYRSEELDVGYAVETTGGALLLHRPRYPAALLHPVAPDEFARDELRLRFLRDTNGVIDRLEVASERARGLLFYREDD